MAEGWDQSLFLEQNRTEDYICPICTDVMRDCVETDCGHLFCEACVITALKEKQECPECRERATEDSLTQIKSIRRKILSLRVKCGGYIKGCEWTGMLKELTNHEHECKAWEEKKPCRYAIYGCKFKSNGLLMEAHYKDDMKEHLQFMEETCQRQQAQIERLEEQNRRLSMQILESPIVSLPESDRERGFQSLADALITYVTKLHETPNWHKLGNQDDCAHHNLHIAPITGIGKNHEGRLKVPMMRGSGLVDYSLEEILAIIEPVEKKGALESGFDKGRIVERFEGNICLRYETYKAVFPTYPRDFLMLHVKRKNPLRDNSVILAQVSVEDPAVRERPGFVRGDHVSAWVVTPTNQISSPNRACFVEYFEHTDLGGNLPSAVSSIVAKSFCNTVSRLKLALKNNGRLRNKGYVTAFDYVMSSLE